MNIKGGITSDGIQPDREIDACGLMCPLPILRARKALSEMKTKQVLLVYSTDLGSKEDFSSFAEQTGNVLLASGENEQGVYWYALKRK
ncbi:MAG: sulfurtransferase TusA family protein [Burkholderiales bacterium]|nr:sulfurtransferase TusA family protein [Burkholderiales bacterium]